MRRGARVSISLRLDLPPAPELPRWTFANPVSSGIRKSAVPITDFGGQTLERYWEDGPQLTGWGVVVAKYHDGTPAIVEGTYGSGWVVLSGVHPEAPGAWRRGMDFKNAASDRQRLCSGR